MENFSIRTQSLLMNAGIKSLQELSEYTAADLLKFRNFGYKSLQEVEPYLKTFDFTIKTDNTQTFQNALQKIEKLETDKAELLKALGDCKERLEEMNKKLLKFTNYSHISVYFASKLNSIIQKHKQ